MPLPTTLNLKGNLPQPEFLTLNNWKKGVITLIDKSRLPKDALAEANNLFLYEDGQPGPRPGVDWFGTSPLAGVSPSSSNSPSSSVSPSASASASASHSLSPSSSTSPSSSQSRSPSSSASPSSSVSPSASASRSLSPSSSVSPSSSASASVSRSLSPSASASGSPSSSASPSSSVSPSASVSASAGEPFAIHGFDYFDLSGAIHLVIAVGGTIYRSLDDGLNWSACTGGALQPDTWVNMLQNGSYLYLTNGVDNIFRYDGSTVLVPYTALTTPAAPTIAETGLASTGFNYYYKVAAANTVGFSIASVASSVVQSSVARDTWDATTNFGVITVPNFQATQTRADIFISENDVDYFYLASTSVSGATYKDDGLAIPNPAITAPTGNTSQGPKVAELVNVGSRMYGVRDTDNPYRIWFSGAGQYQGAFSSAYDGGYINWQTGGKYRPVKVEDYRDGKGTPLATVWCKSADGQGCVLQISLDTLTVGDISITVPSAYRLPGSRGTPAPMSVVNVLNDYFFYNSQAFYNLGSRAQFLNLLSTDESSANIRPSVKQISQSAESEISAVYFDARVYFSVPYGSDENNYTAVFDTERKAWLPKAFDVGFKKFLRYTDTTGTPRLLCLKPGDSQLSEISADFTADYGQAFITTLRTGLYQTTKDRFDFQFTEEGEFEMSRPLGEIVIDMLGIERRQGYTTVVSKTSNYSAATLSDTGWDTFAWDTTSWDDTSDAVTSTAEPSIKKYFTVQKEMNAIEWNITTQDPTARYILRTLQTWGRPTLAGKPRSWRQT